MLQHRRQRLLFGLVVAIAVAFFSAPGVALAALQYDVENFACGGQRGSGNTDTAGNTYIACAYQGATYRPNVLVLRPDGSVRQRIYTGGYITDAAPSPDGRYVFVMTHPAKRLARYVRQAGGGYAVDNNFTLDRYTQWGTTYEALGEFLDTDEAGHLYVVSGTWTNQPNHVIKYDLDGNYITGFGRWEESWDAGVLYWMPGGIAVTPDGSSIYTTEVGNNRIQRWDMQFDGSYDANLFLGNDPAIDGDPRTGWCGDNVRPGRFSAPYDVGIDGAGRVYVLNTTCAEVRIFTAGGGHLHTESLRDSGVRGYIHGMAVADDGTVYLGEAGKSMHPTGAPAGPAMINDAFIGWGKAHAPGGSIDAWLYAPEDWTATVIDDDEWLYVHPFAEGWKWAWRWNDKQWYAVRTNTVRHY